LEEEVGTGFSRVALGQKRGLRARIPAKWDRFAETDCAKINI
jgi:hypothetical protein